MGNRRSKYPYLISPEEIEFIKRKTELSKREIFKWHSIFLHYAPHGFITLDEFISLYKKYYPSSCPENYAKFAFKAFDKDDSGTISFSEFIIAIVLAIHLDKGYDIRKAFEFVFNIYDDDDNGKIDIREMEHLLSSLYELDGQHTKKAKKKTFQLFIENDKDQKFYLDKNQFVNSIIAEPIVSKIFL